MKKRVIAAALLAGALAFSVPGGAIAAQSCGVVVCADASASVTWGCVSQDFSGYDIITCTGVASAQAGGSSALSVPGSATFSGATSYSYSYDAGMTWFTQSWEGAGGTCTWAGLGEDACAGGPVSTQTYTFYVSDFTCVDTGGFRIRFEARSSSTATRSTPLGIATLDSATAGDVAMMSYADLPPADKCAFP